MGTADENTIGCSMTMPFERTRAVLATKEFLVELLNPEQTPRIPRPIRGYAKSLLRHYPDAWDIHRASRWAADVFGPVPERKFGANEATPTDFIFSLRCQQAEIGCSPDELIERLSAAGFTDVLIGPYKPGLLALQLTCAADDAQTALYSTMQAFRKLCPSAALIGVTEHIVRVG